MDILINGSAGRMGRVLLNDVHEHPDCTLVGGLETPNNAHIGQDLGTLFGQADMGLAVASDPLAEIARAKPDAIIDFSTPDASVELAGIAAQARLIHVIGTTGFDTVQQKEIDAAARHARIIQDGNMSLGVTMLSQLVEWAAAQLDENWDIEILELHHRNKRDEPSGTALMLGEAAASGRGFSLESLQRDGVSRVDAKAKTRGSIGFASLRGGSVVCDHDVMFLREGEQLRLTHRAETRDVFSTGAIHAALWGRNRAPGLYRMSDTIDLTKSSKLH